MLFNATNEVVRLVNSISFDRLVVKAVENFIGIFSIFTSKLSLNSHFSAKRFQKL